jgi:hypothetical protein
MAFTMLQGQTDPPYQPTFVDDQGNLFPLTGLTTSAFSIRFERVANPSDEWVKEGTGTWSISGSAATYQWAVADVSMTGTWNIYVYIVTLTGTTRKFLPDTVVILPAPQ